MDAVKAQIYRIRTHGASSSLDRGNQLATLADLQAYAVAERKAQRYDKLEGVIPQKDIDAARLERDALKKRQSAIAASMERPRGLARTGIWHHRRSPCCVGASG